MAIITRKAQGGANQNSAPHATLASEQFPELNATLYESDPATYLRFRLHTLVTMHNQDDESTESTPWAYGLLESGHSYTFSREEREQAIALESTMLVHHASESLLRLFIAHSEKSDCPWLKVAKLDFREVKSKAAEYAKATHVWRPAQIEEVFLGGSDLGTSGVAMSEDEWAQSVDALKELVRRTSERILEQASLYNAAKHGLVGVPGEVAKWSMSSEGGPSLDVAEGRGVTYLLREYPSKAWAAQTDIVDIESDFLIVQLVAIAVHNLWTAARRRYIARKGHLYSLHPQLVDEAFLVGVAGKRNVARGMRVALHRKADRTAPWGKGLEPARYRLNMVRVDKDVAKQLSSNDDRYQVEARELPLRPADTSPFTGGNRTLFPFTPGWASVV